MKGLFVKDLLTIRKKYGIARLFVDIAIMVALMFILEDKGALFISFLLIPLEIMSMVITLATCDEQWRWGKYAISLPVSKKQIVSGRYGFAVLMSVAGLLSRERVYVFVQGNLIGFHIIFQLICMFLKYQKRAFPFKYPMISDTLNLGEIRTNICT